MIGLSLISAFLLGLLGGAHCASMCGGIVTVLGSRHRIIPIQPVDAASGRPAGAAGQPMGALGRSATPSRSQPLAYNAGRIASYTIAGMLVGAAGSTAWLIGHLLPVQQFAFAAANLVMIVLGVTLIAGAGRLVALERVGVAGWKRLAPLAARLLRAPGTRGALAAGLVWGWVPCGMVYGVLAAALVSGSAVDGALLMLAFGLGTLPNLLLLGWLAQRGARWFDRPRVRFAAGLLVISFGLAGIARADPLTHLHGLVDVCLQALR